MSKRMGRTRRAVQAIFLALVLLGVFAWQANCERWCPFGGVEALATYVSEGNMLCSLAISNFFVLGGVIVATLLLRRAFCGYACPIGALSEWLHLLGRAIGLPGVRINGAWDRVLSLGKYVLLVVVLWLTWRVGELIFRSFDPCYALISRHGADITMWAYVVSAAIALFSLFVSLPFCRWFCPLAAVLNPFSRFGLFRIRRHVESCRDCGQCSKACPVAIPVAELEQVRAARCLSCLNCIDVCPGHQARSLSWGLPSNRGGAWSQAALVLILVGCMSVAVAASYLAPVPSFVKTRGAHPGAVSAAEFRLNELTCRGRANLLFYFLDRDDLYRISGYLKVEAWPSPETADLRVTFDPKVTSKEAIEQAITEPYYDGVADTWRMSPFQIEGYDPFAVAPSGE